jgi:hypothetical protein
MISRSVVGHQRLRVGDDPGADLTEVQASAVGRLSPRLPVRAFSWGLRAALE